MSQAALDNLNALMTAAGGNVAELTSACQNYLQIFNEGIHYSFIASVVAMVISLIIFVAYQRRFPTPGKKTKVESQSYTAEEKRAMAKEIKQRMPCSPFWVSLFSFGSRSTKMVCLFLSLHAIL